MATKQLKTDKMKDKEMKDEEMLAIEIAKKFEMINTTDSDMKFLISREQMDLCAIIAVNLMITHGATVSFKDRKIIYNKSHVEAGKFWKRVLKKLNRN